MNISAIILFSLMCGQANASSRRSLSASCNAVNTEHSYPIRISADRVLVSFFVKGQWITYSKTEALSPTAIKYARGALLGSMEYGGYDGPWATGGFKGIGGFWVECRP